MSKNGKAGMNPGVGGHSGHLLSVTAVSKLVQTEAAELSGLFAKKSHPHRAPKVYVSFETALNQTESSRPKNAR